MDAQVQIVIGMFKGCDLTIKCGKCKGEVASRSVDALAALATKPTSDVQSFGMALMQAKIAHKCK